MGNLTHTVSGPVASFKSADIMDIKSIRAYFEPVQTGSGDPTPSNVRPITGWTGLNITTCKRNLYNYNNAVPGYYIESSGDVTTNTGGWSLSGYIKVGGNNKITYSCIANPGTAPYSAWYDKDKNLMTTFKQQSGTNTIVVPNNAVYVQFSLYTSITVHDRDNFTIVAGEESSLDHIDYSGTTYPVSWTSEGTIYGGYVNIVYGFVARTWKIVSINDQSWTYSSTYGRFVTSISDLDATDSVRTTKFYATAFTPIYDGRSLANVPAYGMYSGGSVNKNIFIHTTDYTTEAAFKNALGSQQICYPCFPEYIDITPASLKTYLGQNNIFSNSNSVTDVDYSFVDRLAKKRCMTNRPQT